MPRNGAKRKRLAILTVTVLRGRAPATICNNQPDTHAPSTPRRKRNNETRALGLLRHVGLRNYRRVPAEMRFRLFRIVQLTRIFNPRARVSALLIAAKGQGAKCALSMVADNARARPRKAGQVNGLFVRFLKFRRPNESSESHLIVHAPEFRESHKGWMAGMRLNPRGENGLGPVTGNCGHCRTVSATIGSGQKVALTREATSQHSPGPNLCVHL